MHPEELDTTQKVSVPAHVRTWKASGLDHNNIVPMCLLAHAGQEGKNKEFEAKWTVDLTALAREYYEKYEQTIGLCDPNERSEPCFERGPTSTSEPGTR